MRVSQIVSKKDFKAFGAQIRSTERYVPPEAFAIGIGMMLDGEVVAVQYPVTNLLNENNENTAALLRFAVSSLYGSGTFRIFSTHRDAIRHAFSAFDGDGNSHPNIDAFRVADCVLPDSPPFNAARPVPVVTFIDDLDEPPVDVGDVYLRLHLLSHRKKEPNTINFDGMFGMLKTLAWTSGGIFLPEDAQLAQARSFAETGRPLMVDCLDKLPPMLMMCVPTGVRIADGKRARLGAHLSDGTTVMHEGFCNHNAGTLGKSMVEGRISAGVVVGNGSDIGGGASTMGTLSGGGKEIIYIGEGCLIGANGGTGISLGDGCTIEAGLYLTASTKVLLPDGTTVKARELSGKSNLLYRRNSGTGQVEALPSDGTSWGGLNAALHNN